MSPPQYHESADTLRAETREMHRALRSLIEELDAVDWYAQRIDANLGETLRIGSLRGNGAEA